MCGNLILHSFSRWGFTGVLVIHCEQAGGFTDNLKQLPFSAVVSPPYEIAPHTSAMQGTSHLSSHIAVVYALPQVLRRRGVRIVTLVSNMGQGYRVPGP